MLDFSALWGLDDGVWGLVGGWVKVSPGDVWVGVWGRMAGRTDTFHALILVQSFESHVSSLMAAATQWRGASRPCRRSAPRSATRRRRTTQFSG